VLYGEKRVGYKFDKRNLEEAKVRYSENLELAEK
jgi:hypothetical protein